MSDQTKDLKLCDQDECVLSEQLEFLNKTLLAYDKQQHQIAKVRHDIANMLYKLLYLEKEENKLLVIKQIMALLQSLTDVEVESKLDFLTELKRLLKFYKQIYTEIIIDFVTADDFLGMHVPINVRQLYILLDNLLSNAVAAMDKDCENNRVEFCLKSAILDKQQYLLLEIADNGCGLSNIERVKIFRSGYTSKQQSKGHGLGLSIIREIVEKSQGHIQVESQLGVGTTFRVFLPVIN